MNSNINMDDIIRKSEVSFVSLSCIVQTLWQCQVRIEVTVPISRLDLKNEDRQVTEKVFLVNEIWRFRDG